MNRTETNLVKYQYFIFGGVAFLCMWYGDAYLFSRQFQIVYNVTIFNLQVCLWLLYVNNIGIDGKKIMSFLMVINLCIFDEKLK